MLSDDPKHFIYAQAKDTEQLHWKGRDWQEQIGWYGFFRFEEDMGGEETKRRVLENFKRYF